MTRSLHTASFVAVFSIAAYAVGCDSGNDTGGATGGGGGTTTSGNGTGTATSSGTMSTTGSGTASTGSSSSGGAQHLIDNMEDGDGAILSSEGRVGSWYTFNDGTVGGTQTPVPGDMFVMTAVPKPQGDSTMAARTNGSGFTDYGSGFGFDLNNNGTTKSAYDASAYSGITFFAMAGPGSSKTLRVNVGDVNSAPEGGVCDDVGGLCNDHFGSAVVITEDWQQFTLMFTQLTQVGFGDPQSPAIDKSALFAIQIQEEKASPFDIYVDDIAFVE